MKRLAHSCCCINVSPRPAVSPHHLSPSLALRERAKRPIKIAHPHNPMLCSLTLVDVSRASHVRGEGTEVQGAVWLLEGLESGWERVWLLMCTVFLSDENVLQLCSGW